VIRPDTEAHFSDNLSWQIRGTDIFGNGKRCIHRPNMIPREQFATTPVDYTSFDRDGSSKPSWKPTRPISVIQNPAPEWKYGEGANDNGESLAKSHVEIDPFEEGRPMSYNYSLLVSGIVPRPIGLVSTTSVSGDHNLAPFSYFQVVDHDPPVFVVGLSGRQGRPKDTLRNLETTKECCLNVVSEHMVEAVNASSIDAPHGTSEWDISGLHQMPCSTVKPPRVQESVFSIEGRLIDLVDYRTSRRPSGEHGKLAIIEATRFWAREDAIDSEGRNLKLDVLRPVGQLGGISYTRTSENFELARKNWASALETDRERIPELTRSS